MEAMNGGNGNNQQPQKSHEDQLREFADELNKILSKGYSLPAVIQVLDSALFEFRMSLYMRQMELMEKQRQMQKHIEIPQMKIPTAKNK